MTDKDESQCWSYLLRLLAMLVWHKTSAGRKHAGIAEGSQADALQQNLVQDARRFADQIALKYG